MTLLFNLFPAAPAPQLALGVGALLNLFAAPDKHTARQTGVQLQIMTLKQS
jgi:hypothetical protein